jgi:hypothetical protein
MIDGLLLPDSRRVSARLSGLAGLSGGAGDVRVGLARPRTAVDETTRDTTPSEFERTHWWADNDGSAAGDAVGRERGGPLTPVPTMYDELTSAYD